MDQSLIDRRGDVRRPWAAPGSRATLRPGRVVSLVDLSAGGALVQGDRPLRPGGRVHLQLVTAAGTFVLSAHVVRCAVWALDDGAGATYRGALKFDPRAEHVWREMGGA
ncbi:MAG: PilZ domain-containing protein [Acidobacteriota bacterium]